MHNKRVTTAVLALPALLVLISKGGAFLFFLLVCVAGLLALREYYRIADGIMPDSSAFSSRFNLAGYLATPVFLYGVFTGSVKLTVFALTLNLLITAFLLLVHFNSKKDSGGDPVLVSSVFKQIHGFIYIPGLLAFLVILRGSASEGISWIYLLLIIVAGSDTGAYYVGTYLGKHKLCPGISPKKTVEGFVGGLVIAVAAGSLFKSVFLPEISWAGSVLMFVMAGTVGAAGDLYESVLKRAASIKDSGTLLPGHGGILDRIDALLFAAPIACFFKEIVL